MSTVNMKIIFGKKQKQTRERSTQGRGAEMVVFTLETDHSRVRRVFGFKM